ncbi:MAG TPA: peptide ABC transporter substrate-binding protein [Gemmatimonadales bacterium]|nr:peptide ABC transporter substrate-binding protein [Gemmatimonadales bacterium]
MRKLLWIGLLFMATVIIGWPADVIRKACTDCAWAAIAAVGEPPSIMPALVQETVGRDISDQIYEKLANLSPGKPPIDAQAYVPALAQRWARLDSVTWRFHLRPGARWQDGKPVTSEDVAFSFDVFSDTLLGSPASYALGGRIRIVPENPSTFQVRFTEPSPEQLYDATYHVRILPKHVWHPLPRAEWARDTVVGRLIGSGPYRLKEWRRGEYISLTADSLYPRRPGLLHAVWRFTNDPDAALNLALSDQWAVLETVGSPDRAKRVSADTNLTLVSYPSAAYGFLGFNLAGKGARGAHPILGDRKTRWGLALAVDRATLARAVFGPEAKAPPGPMSQLLWIWNDSIAQPRFNPAEAVRVLAAAGWRRDGTDGMLRRNGRRLSFDILVPSTSSTRRQLAVALQEMWRKAGVQATITTVDFPVFQERLAKGRFDAYMGAYLDEPSPRGLKDQWSRSGWGALNHGRYANPVFDSLLVQASGTSDPHRARRLWREAMDTLNADVPALFLYAPTHQAAIPKDFGSVTIDPYSWLHTLPEWELKAGS